MKKKKLSVFWIAFTCFTLLYISVWIVLFAYVNQCLVRYEAAQPERVVERLVKSIQEDGFESVFPLGEAPTRFEDAEDIAGYYALKLADQEIDWQQDRINFDPHSPSYQICAGEEPLGSVRLHAVSTEPLMSILTISSWEVEKAEPVPIEARERLSVTAPDRCSVLVNGVALGEAERTGDARVSEQFRYVKDYVDVPVLAEYQVQNLIAKPTVEIRDADGTQMAYEESYEGGQTAIVLDCFSTSEMDADLAEMVLANAERYTNFFSGDLEGCQESTKPIADMFPADSYYLKLADTYRREDMWMYSSHFPPTFENEEVSEYIRYSDDLFSCVVYFDKIIQLSKVSAVRTDTTHTRFFYGLLDGKWKILDMQTLLD